MKFEYGDMWSVFDKTDHFIFTGNAIIKRDGGLVMGRGIARAVRDNFPGVDVKIGEHLRTIFRANGHTEYGVLLGSKIGVFQVKHHYRDQADPELIKNSVQDLTMEALRKPADRFDLNYPGIGNGALDKEQVAPLLDSLPDNVHVWQFK